MKGCVVLFFKMQLWSINRKLNDEGIKYAERIVSKRKEKSAIKKVVDERSVKEMKKIAEKINQRAKGVSLSSPCICKSVLCYKILTKKHYDVDLKFGVKSYPFEAHAWVEYHGLVINDSEEYVRKYIVLA